MSRQPYVEDAVDVDVPPPAPSPPPAIRPDAVGPVQGADVFDFLVDEHTPDTSRVSLGGSREQMSMKRNAHSIFGPPGGRLEGEDVHDSHYKEKGFSYGADPVRPSSWAPNASMASLDFMTPAAKTRSQWERTESATHSRTNSAATSDKKRKRGSPEALDLSAIHEKGSRRSRHPQDTPMADAPPSSADTPGLSHSGLTGGLNRLLSEPRNPFPPTPDYSDEKEYSREIEYIERRPGILESENPASPLKRHRTTKETTANKPTTNTDNGFSIKGRAGRLMSMVGNNTTSNSSAPPPTNKETAIVRSKPHRNSSSSDTRPTKPSVEPRRVERKKTRVQRPMSMFAAPRRDSSSQADRDRDQYRDRDRDRDRYSSVASNTSRRRRGSNESPEARRRKFKAIEYHYPRDRAPEPGRERESKDRETSRRPPTDSDLSDDDYHPQHARRGGKPGNTATRDGTSGDRDMVIFGEEKRMALRAESFLSFVTKGPDSERGCSMNKALKRWHRDGEGRFASGSKEEEQKELWKGLRLRRNERGEVVVFF